MCSPRIGGSLLELSPLHWTAREADPHGRDHHHIHRQDARQALHHDAQAQTTTRKTARGQVAVQEHRSWRPHDRAARDPRGRVGQRPRRQGDREAGAQRRRARRARLRRRDARGARPRPGPRRRPADHVQARAPRRDRPDPRRARRPQGPHPPGAPAASRRRRNAERIVKRNRADIEREADRRPNVVAEQVARVENAVQAVGAAGEKLATTAKERVTAIA